MYPIVGYRASPSARAVQTGRCNHIASDLASIGEFSTGVGPILFKC